MNVSGKNKVIGRNKCLCFAEAINIVSFDTALYKIVFNKPKFLKFVDAGNKLLDEIWSSVLLSMDFRRYVFP